MFDDEDEVLIDQMDQLLYELDDESIDESYQDSDESERNESENEESQNKNEDQNKENASTISTAAFAKRKQRILVSQVKLFAAANCWPG
jgi:hypothetical protein